MKKVYLAGKITKNGWRRDIFKDLRSYSEHRDGFWTKEMVMDDYIYQGPYFLANDHGSYHGESTHGRGRGKSNRNMITPDIKNEGSDTVVKKCYKWIDNSDEMFVWLDKEDAYGTIVEIGYARAKNKKIFIAVSNELRDTKFVKDIWFAIENANKFIFAENHLEAWSVFIGKTKSTDYEKPTKQQQNYITKLALEQGLIPDFNNMTKSDAGAIIAFLIDGKEKFKEVADKFLNPMNSEEEKEFKLNLHNYNATQVVAKVKEYFKKEEGIEDYKFSTRKHAEIVRLYDAKKYEEYTDIFENPKYFTETVKYSGKWIMVVIDHLKKENKKEKIKKK